MAYRRINSAPIYDPPGSPSWIQWYNSLVFAVNANGAIDNNTSLNGDATGTNKNGVISITLSATGATPGTYNQVTVDSKGRVTTGNNQAYQNQTITLSGDATGSGATSINVTLNPVTLRTQQTPTTSTKTVTHSIPIVCNGTTYYLLLSATGP